ncbi:radical SAM protein [Aliarcobacter butzleri]|uniref:radical SAM/SPASM domain-containing protein n=1 Tax=Aliarcobacter butzleri TaxID=28197 RepID=UPI0012607E99|nr:radical SAM/SPASM domain-containing protein [Aliarcobacter butzleri]MDN5126631.1 radical SAM protein [Aliarcobacter butzleri]
MEKKFIDPSTVRKDIIVKEKLELLDDFPIFSIVEFNLFGNCNRNCSFCPVSDTSFYKKTKDAISVELYEKIMQDLASIKYKGKLLYSAFCEPLLHKKIEELIFLSKKYLPNCRVEIVSNGDLITTKKLKKLFEAGLDTISISMYDGPHQILHFENMMNEANLTKEQVILRRRYFDGDNFGITISNRAGLIDSNQYRDKNEQKIIDLPLKSNCFYPFYMTLIDYNGDMLLCPHDWKKTTVIGNLAKNNIWDLWKNGKKLNTIRKILSDENRNFTPCKTCDVIGTVIGKDSFEKWKVLSIN